MTRTCIPESSSENLMPCKQATFAKGSGLNIQSLPCHRTAKHEEANATLMKNKPENDQATDPSLDHLHRICSCALCQDHPGRVCQDCWLAGCI